jgi:hypothetical protein
MHLYYFARNAPYAECLNRPIRTSAENHYGVPLGEISAERKTRGGCDKYGERLASRILQHKTRRSNPNNLPRMNFAKMR